MQPTDNSKITLYGAGGHCKVVIDILRALGQQVDKVVDDNCHGEFMYGIQIEAPGNKYNTMLITIGNCKIRKAIAEKYPHAHFPTAIYPSAVVSPSVRIGSGSVVMQGSVVQAGATLGKHCIVNTNASIDHDCRVGDYVHVASGATVCGGVNIGECTWIGAGSVIKQGIKIGSNCMIGAGSIVVKDIPDNSLAYGNPCRVKDRV